MSFGHEHLRPRKFDYHDEDADHDNTEMGEELQVLIPTPTNNGGTHEVVSESALMDTNQPSEAESTDVEVIYSKKEDRVSLIKSSSSANDNEHSKTGAISENGVVREYEVALQHLGVGLFHIILVVCNGIALTSDAVEVLSISFVLPVISLPSELGLEDWQNGLLSSVIFVGMLFGSCVWGGLAGIIGRKRTLVLSLATSGVFGLVSAFSPNYYWFLVWRFVSGFGVGGSLPVLFPYISEFICNKYRGPYLGLQAFFWMFGRFLVGGTAWAIIPRTSIDINMGLFRFHSWRLFLAISAIPSLLGVLLYWFLPESPRYLLEVGQEQKAIKILKRVHRINNWRDHTTEYPVKSIQLAAVTGVRLKRRLDKVNEVFLRTAEMFNKKFVVRTLLLLTIHFCLSFGSYGVTLWYPTYVNEINKQKDNEIHQEFCSTEISGINGSSLSSYCGCNNASISNSIIADKSLKNWKINSSTFTEVQFHRVNFTRTSFLNTVFESSSFIDCKFIDSVISNSTFHAVQFSNLQFHNSRMCMNSALNSSSNLTYDSNVPLDGNVTHHNKTFLEMFSLTNLSDCNNYTLNTSCPSEEEDFRVYRDSFFISASSIPGILVSMVAVYFLIRKYWLAITLMASAISVFLLYVVHDEVIVVVMLCLFTALTNSPWHDSSLIITEVYPTHLRTTAAGIHLGAARVGAIFGTNIFGSLVHLNPNIPILIVVAILIIGALAALPLPKTTRKTLLK